MMSLPIQMFLDLECEMNVNYCSMPVTGFYDLLSHFCSRFLYISTSGSEYMQALCKLDKFPTFSSLHIP